MTAARRLAVVPPSTEQEPADTSYEWRDRQRIRAKNWAAVHVRGDRSAPLPFFNQARRIWRG